MALWSFRIALTRASPKPFPSVFLCFSSLTNLSKTFTGTSSTEGLAANTSYYLKIEPQASTIAEASTTTYNITVATEGN